MRKQVEEPKVLMKMLGLQTQSTAYPLIMTFYLRRDINACHKDIAVSESSSSLCNECLGKVR